MTYEAQLAAYEAALAEWEEICAAMAAEEAAAAHDQEKGPCGLALYCAQQLIALALEMPLRYAWHGTCAAAGCCCAVPCGSALIRLCDVPCGAAAFVEHHTTQLQMYNWLGSIMCENVCVRPCAPLDLYKRDVTLTRPPKPTKPKRSLDDCSCDGCCDCPEFWAAA